MIFVRSQVLSSDRWGLAGWRLVLDWSLPYVPGQWVQLRLPGLDDPRMYSIANPPGQRAITILYTLLAEGRLTPRLSLLKPGDIIEVAGPGGAFEAEKGSNLWIAGGTGIAPFLSMQKLIESKWYGPNSRPTLLQSNKLEDDLYGSEIFSDLNERNLLKYYPFVTQGTNSGPRITEWLDAQDRSFFKAFERIMICGSTSMILDLRDLLLGRGVDFHRIVSEVYF
ncbi:MAG: hypothetical protein GW949_02930 [Spirochaetales bacterium]|nr:hypothetical protein [Spirochaetales bacterium]